MSYGAETKRKKVRVQHILAAKGQRKISSLTCYDATFARLLEKTNLDFILVGDSLGHVVQGKSTTIGVELDEIAYHIKCVAKTLHTPLIVGDIPFGSATSSVENTFQNAATLIKAGAEAVKIEGGTKSLCEQISFLTGHGIPVMGHIGLNPQSLNTLGGYRIQGKDSASRKALVDQATRLQDAGCFAIVLELVNADTAAAVTQAVDIPTIGIGAGSQCDGQILVLQDMLGMNLGFTPKFLKRFAELENTTIDAVNQFCSEVENSAFPKGNDD